MVLIEISYDITLIVVFNGCKGHTWLYNKSQEFKEFLFYFCFRFRIYLNHYLCNIFMFWVKLETMLCENRYFSPKASVANLKTKMFSLLYETLIKDLASTNLCQTGYL